MARVLSLLSWVLAMQLLAGQNNQANADNRSETTVIFESISGTIAPGQTATLTVKEPLPTIFAVIFKDSDTTITAATYTLVPTSTEANLPLVIPSALKGTEVKVLISTGRVKAFPIQTLPLQTSAQPVTTSASPLVPSSPATSSASEGPGSSQTGGLKTHLGPIVGGALGGAIAAMLILIALCVWGKLRYRRKCRLADRECPATFRGDLMVKSQVEPSFASFNPFSVPPTGRASSNTRSIASPRSSSVEKTNKIAPALESYTQSMSSDYSEGQGDSESSLHRDSWTSEMYENARLGFGRLSPRTDRQMDIEQRKYDLKAQLIALSDGSQGSESTDDQDSHIVHIKAKIKRLENLEFSDWAMGLTNEVPKDF
ncbi:hypothetical protein GYMLUDRAFT_261223 [Collybiopsis luxurians FD-317 M1]|uniref:Mid2 domain-containing protein n=1 Tax=Collybiopsis luxurians FD-317 M1 TaxID=944289 RepID=A0A0D0CEC2_9AGAR|nr:hypothetical protein GYMLUDRAFT_261223 [Collybiopsis luxurians FD-317 M1]